MFQISRDRQLPDGDQMRIFIILEMVVSVKVGCLRSSVGKQPSDQCLHAQMPDVSYSGVISGPQTLNGGDNDDES